MDTSIPLNPECATSNPTLIYDNLNPVQFTISGNVTISGVNLSGKTTLLSGCNTEKCMYCGVMTVAADGTGTDDQSIQHQSGTYVTSSACNTFMYFSFMILQPGAILSLLSLAISDFRQGLGSLFTMTSGFLTFEYVSFVNISTNAIFNPSTYPSYEVTNAIIQQNSTNSVLIFTSSRTYEQGGILLDHVSVSLLNNGYEISGALWQYGFLSVNGIKSVRIVNSTFTNIIIQNGSLLSAFAFLTFTIDNCVFDTIYVENFIIRLTPTGLLTLTPGPDNEPDEYYLDHVLITNTVFTHISVSVRDVTVPGSLLYLVILGAGLNVHMENLEFSHCEAVTWLLYIYHFVWVLSTTEMQGTVVTYTNSTTSFNMTVPKIWTRIKSVRFDSVFVGATLLEMDTLTNVEINNVTIVNSGDTAAGISANDLTLKFMIAKPGVYLTQLLSNIQMPNCQTVVSILNCYNITILNSFFGNDTCNNGILGSNMFNYFSTTGQGGIHTSSLTGDFSMTDVEMIDISGPSVGGGTALIIDTTGLISLKNVRIRSCTNYGSSGTGIATISPVAITKIRVIDCVFEDNSSQGAVVQIRNGGGLWMNSSVFKSNQSKNQATLYFIPGAGLTSINVDISESQFILNSGGDGTALYLTNIVMNPVTVNLQISSTTFQDNVGTGAGTAIFIDNKSALDKSSYVKNCDFLNNTASDGVVNVAFLSGALSIDECRFKNNAGEMVAGISASQLPNTPKNPTFISISNSRFSGNTGTSLIKLGNPNGYELLHNIANCFQNNGMQIFTIDKSIVFDTGSVYQNNAGSSYHATTMSQLNITDSAFINGTGSGGGAAYLGGGSVLNCTNCTFQGNSVVGYGGALYIEQDSVVTSINSQFIRNYAGLRGAAVYIFGSTLESSFKNTLFQENECGDSATVAVISSLIQFLNSTFLRNSATRTALISAYFSNAVLMNSTIAEHRNLSSPLIYSALESNMYISGCSFTDVETSGSGGVVYALSSRLLIVSSQFSSIRAFSGALILAEAGSVFSVTNSQVTNVTSSMNFGGIIFATAGSGEIVETLFQTYDNSAIIGTSLTSLTLSNVSFIGNRYADGSGTIGGALYCSGCISVNVTGSIFSFLTADSGAAVYLTASTQFVSASFASFTSCVFSHLNSSEAAVYLYNENALFQECEFEQCHATLSIDNIRGIGGAISLYCPDVSGGCNVTINSCEFVNNSAAVQGGSIYWQDSKPVINNSSFLHGSAFYGPDIASYPVTIRISAIEGNATIITNSSVGNFTNRPEGVLFDIASGQIATQIITASLLDHYGQVVLTNTGTAATLGTNATDANIFGTTTFSVVNGTYLLTGFGVIARPETSTTIFIKTNAINYLKEADARDNLTYTDSVQLSAVMRTCQIGESLVGDQCVVCPPGKYSLDPSKSCQDCPVDAICYGNFTMVPREGNWRSSMYTDVFWTCPYEPSCIGSPVPPESLSFTGQCAPGYFGNLCNGCLPGFSRLNQAECGLCPTMLVNTVRTTGIGLAVLIFFVLVVYFTIRSAYKTRSYFSIYIKILLNYLQLVMLTASFNLSWPTYVVQLFKIQQSAGDITDQIFSVDCFITGSNENDQGNAVRLKIVMIAFMPVILFLASFVFWLLIATIKRRFSLLKNEMVTTNVVFFFLVHPSIMKFMFDFVNCKQLDGGHYWMNSYLNIACWDTVHYRYTFAVALPSILVWGLGLPTLCLLYLIKYHAYLDLVHMRLRLGFIYNGYERSKYFWELVILYRKVLIISISVFLSNISTYIQALTVMLVILIALGLQSKHKPYIVPAMNELELRGIFVGGVTIYIGMYCLAQYLDFTTQLILFIVILIVNVYFLSYWIVRVVIASLDVLKRHFPCLFRLCGFKPYQVQPRGIDSTVPLSSNLSDMPGKAHESSEISISRVRSKQVDDDPDCSRPQRYPPQPVPENSFVSIVRIIQLEETPDPTKIKTYQQKPSTGDVSMVEREPRSNRYHHSAKIEAQPF